MAERQYSVALVRMRPITGPKPMEKRSTPTPESRATQKWPSSWMRMSTPSTTTKGTMVVSTSRPRAAGRGQLGGEAPGHRGARGRVHGHAGLDVGERLGRHRVEGLRDQLGDLHEADLAGEEGGHRDLVGGIEHHRRAVAGGQRL